MHLDEGTIHAWLDGALDAEEASRVERHAAECATCAAAVAEARGLVAGASRILSALDGVPGGVVPKTTTAAASAMRARRPRSLWTTLHLTPARAAAAAVIVLAAGSALVIRNAPNAARSAVKLADYSRDSTAALQPAAPMVVPHAAPDVATSGTLPATPQRASARVMTAKPVPKPVRETERRVGGVVAAEKARSARAADELAVLDSVRVTSSADSVAKKEAAPGRSAVAENVVRGGVAGAAPRAAAAAPPPSALGQQFNEAKTVADARSIAGCYDVTADSAVALPPRLWLDSSLIAQTATLQRSRALADARAIERRGVSALVNDTRQSIADAYWAPRGDGSIRLSLPAIGLNLELQPGSASTLTGTAAVGGRMTKVMLRRTSCSQ